MNTLDHCIHIDGDNMYVGITETIRLLGVPSMYMFRYDAKASIYWS